jgi:hypothetical protein
MVPPLIERSAYKYAFSLLKGGMALLEERLLYTVMNGTGILNLILHIFDITFS